MPITLGTSTAGGGSSPDEKLQRRLAVLTELATEEGILGPKKRALLPLGLKTAFAKVVDVISRPNYAVAGVFDELQGTGRADETIGGRVIRELFTRSGDKERFGDVLREAGYAEGGRLSDVVPLPDLIERRFDPTFRGTVGLAMDVLADPLSWTGVVGGGVKVAGVAGEKALSKAGLAFMEDAFKKRLAARAVALGSSTHAEVSRLVKGGTVAEWGALEEATLRAAGQERLWAGLGENAAVMVRSQIQEQAERATLRAIEAGQRGLEARRAIGLTDPFGLAGGRGVPIVPLSAVEKPFAAVKDAFVRLASGTERGEKAVEAVRGFRTHLDQWFNRVNVLARRLPQYSQAEAENFALRQGSRAMAEQVVARGVFGPELARAAKFDRKEWELLTAAADNPTLHEAEWLAAAEKLGVNGAKVLTGWRNVARAMFQAESHPALGLIQSDRFIERYIPHIYKDQAKAQQVLQRVAVTSGKYHGADIGDFAKLRVVDTLDEAIALGLDPVLNPWELMVRRVQAHADALADHEFSRRVQALVATAEKLPADTVLRTALPKTVGYLQAQRRTPRPEDAETLADLMGRSSTVGGAGTIGPREIARLGGLSREAQSAFLYELLSNVKSADHLAKVVAKYGPVWSRIAPETLADVRKAMARYDAGARFAGQRLVPVRVKLRGRDEVWDLPEGIALDLQNWERRWLENPEVRGVLRAFDYASNTFKLWVTAAFPAFHVRNAYSNVAASLVDIGLSAVNPARHRAALEVMLGRDGTLRLRGGRRLPYQAVRQELAALGLTKRPDYWVQELVGRREAFRGGPLVAPLVKRAERTGQAIEEEARILHYMSLRQQGFSPAAAARRLREFLFDYADLSPTEKGAFRRLFPFYTWQSKNVRRQVRNLLSHPGRVAAQLKPFNIGDRGPSPDLLPEYLRGELTVGLEPGQGKKAAFITNIDLPINNIDVLDKGEIGATLRGLVSQLNPLFKAPLEVALNMDSFTGRPIKGSQFMGRTGPALQRIDQALGGWLETREVRGTDGVTRVKANGTKVHLLLKSWAVARFINTSPDVASLIGPVKTEAERDAARQAWWRLLTGLQFREFSFTEAQRTAIRNQVERLERELVEKGLLYEMTVRGTVQR